VFLMRNNQTAAFQPVETGIEEPTRIEILSGLKDDDRVITTGAAGLRNGDRILLPRGSATDGPGGEKGPRGPGAPRDGESPGRPPAAPAKPQGR
jgi:hypothetical protein